MSEVVLTLPDNIAKEAEGLGLFKTRNMTSMLRAEIRRRKSDKFFEIIDRLAEVSGEPMSNEEINAEISAARATRKRQ